MEERKKLNYNKAEFLCSYGRYPEIPPSKGPEIAFSGRSNVGKSSLINKLFNRRNMARVSSVPGKTVTINFFSVEDMYFVDLPGYGYASVSKSEKSRWGDLIGSYLADPDRDLELVIQLIDMRHAPSKDDLQMIDYLIENGQPFIIVFTKADKLKPTARKERMAAFAHEIPCFEDITSIPVSSETGEGIEELKAIIEEIRDICYSDPDEEEDTVEAPDEEQQEGPGDTPGISPEGFLIPRGRR